MVKKHKCNPENVKDIQKHRKTSLKFNGKSVKPHLCLKTHATATRESAVRR